MRLFVLGATGRTGGHLIDLALARGHDVTAFARSPHKLAPASRLAIVPGRAGDPDAVAAALVGHDAVLSAFGPRPVEALRPHTLLGDLAAATVRAMTAAAVRRVVAVSAALLFPERGLAFALLRRVLGHHIRDLFIMERTLTAPHLEWTIARPPRLVAGRRDETYRGAVDALPPGPRAMSFRAVAAFMLDAVERGEHVREIVGLGP